MLYDITRDKEKFRAQDSVALPVLYTLSAKYLGHVYNMSTQQQLTCDGLRAPCRLDSQ
jgi:hypothetical protein